MRQPRWDGSGLEIIRLSVMLGGSDPGRGPGDAGSFGVARDRWLDGLGNVRNVVRQEIIARQLRILRRPRPTAL